MSKLRSVLIWLLPLIAVSLLPIIAVAQTTTSDQAKAAYNSLSNELDALCVRADLQPHFSKTPCKPEDTTLEQMTDKSHITNAEKVVLSKAWTESGRISKKMLAILRQFNPQYASLMAAHRQEMEKEAADFYEGLITRGEYNKRRMEIWNKLREDFAASKKASVALKKDGGIFVVPVEINGAITLDFGVDSGASVVTVPADVFSTLTRTGTIKETDIIGETKMALADGSTSKSFTFTIRSLKVGDNLVQNVRASVTPARGDLLLGQSFLGRFKSWSIDNSTHQLNLQN